MKRSAFWVVGLVIALMVGARAIPLLYAAPAAAGTGGYAVIRHYHVKHGAAAEVAKRAQAGFAPIISQTPGFMAWYLVDTGKDTIVTISVFKDKAGADESTKRAAQWVKQNLAALVPNPPEISAGPVTAQKGK